MKKSTRILALCAAVMTAASLGACGNDRTPSSAGSGSSAAPDGGVDTSKKVSLTIWTMGASDPKDMDMVNEAANEILLDKLNCTADIHVMADWSTRYTLALSSGEAIDLIWTAMWYSYQPYAFDGAWLDISTLVDEVAPELRTLIGQDTWDMSKIQGKDYCIPTNNRAWSQWGVAWREDLRKKYGCPEITDWETMEAYAAAILANEPGMIPFCDSSSGGLWHSCSEKTKTYVGLGNPQFSYGVGVDPASNELYIYHEADWFKDYLETQRRWVQNGYTQPDVASSTDTGNAGMLSGKYAGSISSQGTATTLTGLIVPARESNPDWEIGYMNFGEMFQWSYRAHPTFMAYALPKACPNPERTLLFVQEVMTNDELFRLYDCGIEGVHYEIDENGYYVSKNDPLNPGFLQSSIGLTSYLYNDKAKVYSEDYQWVLEYEKNHLEPYEIDNYFEGFPEDYSAYSDKVTAMSEINTQYTWPLLRGTMEDVDAALADVNSRLDTAGRQEVYQSVKEQYAAYLKELGVE